MAFCSILIEGRNVRIPLVARRAARLDVGKSTSTVRVPWQGTSCVPCQVELRSRHIEAGSAGLPRERGARHQGRPSFGYFSWPRKKSDQPPGCPRSQGVTHVLDRCGELAEPPTENHPYNPRPATQNTTIVLRRNTNDHRCLPGV